MPITEVTTVRGALQSAARAGSGPPPPPKNAPSAAPTLSATRIMLRLAMLTPSGRARPGRRAATTLCRAGHAVKTPRARGRGGAQQAASDDEAEDLRGALRDAPRAYAAVEPLQGVARHHRGAAGELDGAIHHASHRLGGERLGHGGLHVRRLARLGARRRRRPSGRKRDPGRSRRAWPAPARARPAASRCDADGPPGRAPSRA